MRSIKLADVDKLLDQVRRISESGIDFATIVGKIRIEDLGIDLGFNNMDCTGACNTSCSGCSACSGCSGCSSTDTVKAFHPGETVSNPNPLDRFVASLADPSVREALANAAKLAAG